MRSETGSSDWTDPLEEWSPLLARHYSLAKYQAEHEPRMQTVTRKVCAQPPAPPAPKKKPERPARRSWKRGWVDRSVKD